MNFTKVYVKIKPKRVSKTKSTKLNVKKSNKVSLKQSNNQKSIYETIAKVMAARKYFEKIPQTWRLV